MQVTVCRRDEVFERTTSQKTEKVLGMLDTKIKLVRGNHNYIIFPRHIDQPVGVVKPSCNLSDETINSMPKA